MSLWPWSPVRNGPSLCNFDWVLKITIKSQEYTFCLHHIWHRSHKLDLITSTGITQLCWFHIILYCFFYLTTAWLYLLFNGCSQWRNCLRCYLWHIAFTANLKSQSVVDFCWCNVDAALLWLLFLFYCDYYFYFALIIISVLFSLRLTTFTFSFINFANAPLTNQRGVATLCPIHDPTPAPTSPPTLAPIRIPPPDDEGRSRSQPSRVFETNYCGFIPTCHWECLVFSPALSCPPTPLPFPPLPSPCTYFNERFDTKQPECREVHKFIIKIMSSLSTRIFKIILQIPRRATNPYVLCHSSRYLSSAFVIRWPVSLVMHVCDEPVSMLCFLASSTLR